MMYWCKFGCRFMCSWHSFIMHSIIVSNTNMDIIPFLERKQFSHRNVIEGYWHWITRKQKKQKKTLQYFITMDVFGHFKRPNPFTQLPLHLAVWLRTGSYLTHAIALKLTKHPLIITSIVSLPTGSLWLCTGTMVGCMSSKGNIVTKNLKLNNNIHRF